MLMGARRHSRPVRRRSGVLQSQSFVMVLPVLRAEPCEQEHLGPEPRSRAGSLKALVTPPIAVHFRPS
jgi:hypothetical protein